MLKKKKSGIIILGGHVQGLGILRILGEKEIPGILIDNTKINIARHSKYCKTFYSVKDNLLLAFLLSLGRTKKYLGWLIFPTNDFHVKLLSQNKTKLEQYFKVSTPAWQIVEPCYNKRLTYKLAQKLSIPIPRTWMPDSLADIKYNEIEYPCIIKPAIMHSFYLKFNKKVFICTNKQELISNYQKAQNVIPSVEIIIQEIIPGTPENQYSACFLYNKKESLVSFVARRKRQHPIDFGNATTFAETVEDPGLIKISEKILKTIKFTGICEVEFKKDERDGKFKFLEINPRTWKWHSIAEKTDSPFLLSLYHFIYHLSKIKRNDYKIAAFKHILTDTPIIFKMMLKCIYIPSKVKNIRYAVWDKNDIWPSVFEIIYLPSLILNR